MANPITGTLNRTVATYPYPGHGAEFSAGNPGNCIVDSTNDIVYFTLFWDFFASDWTILCKYVYSTNTLSTFATLSLSSPAYAGGCLPITFNADETKIIAACPESAGGTRFYEILTSNGTVTDLGLITGIEPIQMLRFDSTLGYVGKQWQSKDFYSINLTSMTASVFLTLPYFCSSFDIDSDFIYTNQGLDVTGTGPLVRLHRNKGYLMEFLMGASASTTAMASDNPDYASFTSTVLDIISRGNSVYIVHYYSGAYWLIVYNKTTRAVKTILTPLPYTSQLRNLGVSPDGAKVFTNLKFSGISIYT